MLTLTITVDTEDELAPAMERVAQLVKEGYSGGHGPTWGLKEETPGVTGAKTAARESVEHLLSQWVPTEDVDRVQLLQLALEEIDDI